MTTNIENQPKTIKVEGRKTIFEFEATECPTISDYNSLYAEKYGQYPDVRCIINVDENNCYQRQQDPQFKLVNGLIDTISFDLGGAESGCLVLS